MINANKLLRELVSSGHPQFTHKKVTELLNGIKWKSTPKDIQIMRKTLNKYFESIDKKLEKLETE